VSYTPQFEHQEKCDLSNALEDVLRAMENGREVLLRRAVADVKKWCVSSDKIVDKRDRPDTFWIELFDPENADELSVDNARQFLITFRLIRASWDIGALATLIDEFRRKTEFDPLIDIPTLANGLREHNARRTRQTSAASKIAAFAKPKAKVFIWDDLATKSARRRDWKREPTNRVRPSSALYTNGGEHDYPEYFLACERAFAEECSRADFAESIQTLERDFSLAGGIMANREKIPREFIQRRLLDKLMYWEGWSLKKQQLPRL
jgi:hypothetical protein